MSKRNLSHINTLADLRREIQVTDARLKLHEEELKTRLKRIPGEGLKSGISLLLPVYLNNKVFDKSWQLVTNAIGALGGKGKDKAGQSKKRGIFGIASQLGLFTLAKTAYKLWKGK
ncbi:hypothetical protein QTN47_26865 [Danxiaibacter flavus]|uniref:DUF3318 domain-containing protein n=1 Tax=Danxiaibacter flavus TaxID=3049108 RepID=A0ABV3ZNI8_9BACT|nr:hypothetical protein QNM32_26865 [Chitinophagaceae bacterium DXS]